MSMFDKYSLVVDHHKDDGSIYVFTKPDTMNILSDFLYMWKNPEDIKEVLLSDIDRVLNGEVEEEEVDADVVGVAEIGPEETFIGNSYVGYEQMLLPTKDFKQLWLEWIEILEDHEKTKKPWGYVPTSWNAQKIVDELNYTKKNMKHLFGNTYEGKTMDSERIKLVFLDGLLRRVDAKSVLTNDYSKKVDLPKVKL